ncbi:hypothetical protein NQZ68_025072 [Dissostichus eleginoides]|nr:hypothetical protein NQZ68_025072 [Dissostichus eleginoides]
MCACKSVIHPKPSKGDLLLVLNLVSTPARGNENSWEATESRTARQSKSHKEEGRLFQG